jgi:hypothetical protein
LGFHDGSLVNGEDWRLDVLLAFGKNVYTMKVGIGGQLSISFPTKFKTEKYIFSEINEFGTIKHIRKEKIQEIIHSGRQTHGRNSGKRNNFPERQTHGRNFPDQETTLRREKHIGELSGYKISVLN